VTQPQFLLANAVEEIVFVETPLDTDGDGARDRVRISRPGETKSVGMTGVSYNGTLPNQVATTGVEGLKTIIPVSAISSWYDYYRANGLVVAPHSEAQGVGESEFLGEDTDVLADFIAARMVTPRCARVRQQLVEQQDRRIGDWSSCWEARDYLSRVRRVRASVFVVHGLNDWNVETKPFAEWWYRLADRGIPRKLWLHNGGHGGPGPAGSPAALAYKRAEDRWFDYWLFGVQNGHMGEPRLTIQREDGSYHDEADWPAEGARTARLRLAANSATAPGQLTTRSSRGSEQSFVDRRRELDTDDVLIQNPDQANPNRLVYRSPALTRDVRLSGTPWVDLRMSIDNRNAANLTAVLVDYGPDGAVMVTRGWLDPQNRHRLDRSKGIRQGPRVRLPLGPAARRLHLARRSPDRSRRRLDRPRLHDPAASRHRAHARPGSKRDPAADRGRRRRTRVLARRRLRSIAPGAVSSAGQSACLTSRRSPVRAGHRPLRRTPAIARLPSPRR
jgi:predicted acyl esterase